MNLISTNNKPRKKNINCPLCFTPSPLFLKPQFHRCGKCDAIFRHSNYHLSALQEKERYETHNNDVYDLEYQKFVSPITNAVLKNHTVKDKGLDFGAGTGPVISKVLKDQGYQIKQYDPFIIGKQP